MSGSYDDVETTNSDDNDKHCNTLEYYSEKEEEKLTPNATLQERDYLEHLKRDRCSNSPLSSGKEEFSDVSANDNNSRSERIADFNELLDYDHLDVSAEVDEMFQFIHYYSPETVELETRLYPFIPDYIAAVGDADAFLAVPRPDGKRDNLGLIKLDEPSITQSDAVLLDLQLRATSKQKTTKEMVVKVVEDPEKNVKEIEKWVKNMTDLHLSKPPPKVHYLNPMPDLTSLMSAWPEDFEKTLKTVELPNASLDCSLVDYIDIVCGIMDIPVYKNNRIQSLHLLFSLYLEFKNSQHFQKDESRVAYNEK
nr:hypothetical transcript [Hymenolepis microstoma]